MQGWGLWLGHWLAGWTRGHTVKVGGAGGCSYVLAPATALALGMTPFTHPLSLSSCPYPFHTVRSGGTGCTIARR